jgi:hypothetical protein
MLRIVHLQEAVESHNAYEIYLSETPKAPFYA